MRFFIGFPVCLHESKDHNKRQSFITFKFYDVKEFNQLVTQPSLLFPFSSSTLKSDKCSSIIIVVYDRIYSFILFGSLSVWQWKTGSPHWGIKSFTNFSVVKSNSLSCKESLNFTDKFPYLHKTHTHFYHCSVLISFRFPVRNSLI